VSEADAERPDHIERVALLQRRQAVRAAADALIQKFDPPAPAIDAIDALRAPEEQFADVGRRAEQIEELARRDGQSLGRGLDHEMFVFGIHPVMRNHRRERFLGRNVRRRRGSVALADDIGIGRKGLACHAHQSNFRPPASAPELMRRGNDEIKIRSAL